MLQAQWSYFKIKIAYFQIMWNPRHGSLDLWISLLLHRQQTSLPRLSQTFTVLQIRDFLLVGQ